METDSIDTYQDEQLIDVRPYVLSLIRYWWIVAAAVGVAMLAALALGMARPPVYQAEVSLISMRSMAELELEPRFRTSVEGLASDAANRRATLQGLIRNATIAAMVLEEISDLLPTELRDPNRLLRTIEGEVERGDVVTITVRWHDPSIAALVADAWGRAYEQHTNELYAGAIAESWEAVSEEAARALADYEAAEAAYIAFLRDTRIADLQLGVDQLQAILQQRNAQRVRLELLLEDARGLLAQLESGAPGDTSSNSIALALLKREVYAPSEGIQLQFDIGSTGVSDQATLAADARTMVGVIEARLSALEDWSSATGQVENAPLYGELRAMQAALEEESGRERALRHEREVTWDTYATLSLKAQEMLIESTVPAIVVRRASEATVPSRPLPRNVGRNTLLAGMAALMASVGLVVVATMYQESRGAHSDRELDAQ